MNTQISRLFLISVALFALLVGFSSRWSVFDAEQLRDDPKNKRDLVRSITVPRGVVRDADGGLLARSTREAGGQYVRTYPQGELFSHAVGYSYLSLGQAGLERSRDEDLSGRTVRLSGLLSQLAGGQRRGDEVVTTLRPAVQRAAVQGLAGKSGAVVALEPSTGKVLAMASSPSYDPNELSSSGVFRRLSRDDASPVLNRATQALLPPGSTMKVVTAAAALDSGRFDQNTTVDGSNGKQISGAPLNNFGGEDFGAVTLRQALTSSINTAYAQVAVSVGKDRMADYMERFGFGTDPPLDYPDGQMAPSGPYRNGKRIGVRSRFVDVGRLGIGQDTLLATPTQMAMVASAVANGGRLMRPRLTDRIVDPDGRVVERIRPDLYRRVMKTSTASELTSMMTDVVKEGSGTAAALQGISVAGKTGTAELNLSGLNQPWFIGFAPAGSPKVAVAVTLDRVQGGIGGTVAAPVASRVMQAALR